MKRNIEDNIKELFQNKFYIIITILIAVAAYGFAITHFSLGIDDFGINHYMDISPSSNGNMLQQGRLLHIVFYYLTGLVDVIPFLNNFIGTLLLFFSAVLFVGIIDTITQKRFGTFTKIIFSGLYISNSIISFNLSMI